MLCSCELMLLLLSIRALAIKAIDEKLAELAKDANFPATNLEIPTLDSAHKPLLPATAKISS